MSGCQKSNSCSLRIFSPKIYQIKNGVNDNWSTNTKYHFQEDFSHQKLALKTENDQLLPPCYNLFQSIIAIKFSFSCATVY